MGLISGGFYVTRLVEKPGGLGELLPDRVLTLTGCLAEFLPGWWAFDWASPSETDCAAALRKLGLEPEVLPLIREVANAALLAGDLGWSNVWHSATAAQDLLSSPGIAGRDLLLLELAVPEDCVPALLSLLAPVPGQAESGLYTRLKTALPPSDAALQLGWELLGLEIDGSCHSWLCNDLPHQAHRRLGTEPGPLGLLQSEQDARAVLELVPDELRAEPGPWFPGRLSRIA